MRPIDADALIENLNETLNELTTDASRACLCTTIIMIACAPTIEQERKTGHWINVRDGNIADCGMCNARGRAWMNFCPICGADMRGEQNGSER